jgi:predicted Rossmann fold nucleotide-binding protein DprA/Smf involved in DNA uptake
VAIAGEYNASPAWRKIERDIAAEPGHAGLLIVSGLTLGIDGVAHAESLKTGTAAVPGGRIVSESPAGDKARAQDFPRRNRTSTGLTRGTVMAETAARSGSLISPQMAGKKGREVMAVPGSQLDPAPLAQTACSVRAPHWRPARRTCWSCWRGYRRFMWPRPRPGLQAGLSGQPGPPGGTAPGTTAC